MSGEYVHLHEYPERYPLLREAMPFVRRIFRKGGKQWGERLDIDAAMCVITGLTTGYGVGVHAAIMNGTHLLVYSVSSPWYAPGKRWLVEQFFLRIAPGDSAGAYAAIENLAHDLEADTIVMATALARDDAALGRLYEQYGYTQQSTQYIKEAAWLQSAQLSPG